MRALPHGVPFGPFILETRLATGGSAEVFLAHAIDPAIVPVKQAIKRLLPKLKDDPAARAMLAQEAAMHRRFAHPNVVRCFGAGEVDGEPYLAMELVDGVDLHRLLRLARARQHRFPPTVAAHIAIEVLAALAEVHGKVGDDGKRLGIVHRDVTPSNVYLSATGDVKLGDFGIAESGGGLANVRGVIVKGPLRGKHGYVAPEQIGHDAASVDARADLFSLAVVLLEMLTAGPVFAGSGDLSVLLAIRDVRTDALERVEGQLPAPLLAVIRKAIARDPDDRYDDARAFAAALAPFAAEDRSASRAQIAQMILWARQTSTELRAVGAHPEQVDPRNMSARSIARSMGEDPVPTSQVDTIEIPSSDSRVKLVDGRVFGPISYAKVLELAATGNLPDDAEVDFMGRGFRRVRDVPELARHVEPRSVTTLRISTPDAPDWSGPIRIPLAEGVIAAGTSGASIEESTDPGLPAAFAYVAGRSGSGVLIAEATFEGQPPRRKELYFQGGKLYFVPSSDPSELLGEYLVGRGLLTRTDLDFTLAVLPRFQGRLGEALTGLGLVEPIAMFRVLNEQGRDKVVDLFTWTGGTLTFYDGARPSRADFPLDLPVGPLIEAGVSAITDDRAITTKIRPLLDRRMVVREVSPSLRQAGWSTRIVRLLSYVQTPNVLRAVLRSLSLSGLTPHDAARTVEAARLAGLVGWA
ncbi:MAG: serine/threonine protein kinase [Polyangiales bacterium]